MSNYIPYIPKEDPLHSSHKLKNGEPNTMANTYESMWNLNVMKLPERERKIIVNHEDDHPEWDRIQSKLAKETIKIAEEPDQD